MRKKIVILLSMLAIAQSTLVARREWQLPAVTISVDGAYTTPQIALDPFGNAICVWASGEHFTIQSNRYDINTGWVAADPVTISTAEAQTPDIAVDAHGNWIAVWDLNAEGIHVIQARRYMAGFGWEITTDSLSDPSQNAETPQIVMDASGNGMAIWAWYDSALGYRVIQACRYTVGVGWGSVETISNVGYDSDVPQIAMSGLGKALAVWRVADANYTIYANHFDGSSWGTNEPISDGSQSADFPTVAMDALGNGMGVWEWYDAGAVVDYLLARKYVDGLGWSATDTLSDAGGYSPEIAMAPQGTAIVIWVAGYDAATIRYDGTSWGEFKILNYDEFVAEAHIAMSAKQSAIAVWRTYSPEAVVERDKSFRAPGQEVKAKRYILGAGWDPIATTLTGESDYPRECQVGMSALGDGIAIWDGQVQGVRYGSTPYSLLPFCMRCKAMAEDYLYS